jgi:bifunctional DNA-binding transcriptional regulator/antitoxin component of YhaV-PrlF toxin-antitoxin module
MRKRHGLLPGTEIIVEDAGEAIVLKPAADQSGLVEKDGLMVFRGRALGDLDVAIRSQRTDRLRTAGGIPG